VGWRVILGDFEVRVGGNVISEGICVRIFICALEVHYHNLGALRLQSHKLNKSFYGYQPCRGGMSPANTPPPVIPCRCTVG